MKSKIDPVSAKFKVLSKDFIVEEMTRDEQICKISDNWETETKLENIDLENKKDFLWCQFEKKDIDQFRSLREFSSQLNTGIDAIGFAGTKDKKAWTCQRISIFKPNIDLIKTFQHDNIHIKNFRWNKRKIKMGYLDGNRFTIILRDIDRKDAMKITNQIKRTKEFPNYFGKQRFGSVRGNNDKIGKLIIKRKFKEAIFAILTDTSNKERKEVIEAREKLTNEKDFKKALNYFPPFLRFERNILMHLAQNRNDHIGALKRTDRKQVLMFVHAVQSRLFNDILENSLAEGIDFSIEGQKKIPLIGYKTRFDPEELGEIEKEILAKYNINTNDFDVKEIPFLRIKGQLRNALIEVKNLTMETEDDELYENTKKITLKFDLPSGVYATTFLENFFILEEVRN